MYSQNIAYLIDEQLMWVLWLIFYLVGLNLKVSGEKHCSHNTEHGILILLYIYIFHEYQRHATLVMSSKKLDGCKAYLRHLDEVHCFFQLLKLFLIVGARDLEVYIRRKKMRTGKPNHPSLFPSNTRTQSSLSSSPPPHAQNQPFRFRIKQD